VPEPAAPAKVPLHAPDQAFEHLAHLGGPQGARGLPRRALRRPPARPRPGR
jgi:hypothetical protein